MVQRTKKEWLDDLQNSGERRDCAQEDLRAMLALGLSGILSAQTLLTNADMCSLAEQITQKTQDYVLKNLNAFDGRSEFSTWALKYAVRQVFLELRHQRWQTSTPAGLSRQIALQEIPPAYTETLVQNAFLQRFHQIIKEELSEQQRMAIRAMIMLHTPKEEVARFLGMELCEYFNMIHDARLRLKRRFELEGLLPREE